MKPIEYAIIIIMFSIVFGCSACSTSRLQNRSVPPAEGGDPFLGVSVTNASGPFSVTSAIDTSLKEGRSEAYSILNLVSFGDASSAKASKDGGIDIIKESSVDILKVRVFLIPIFTKYTTVVRGK